MKHLTPLLFVLLISVFAQINIDLNKKIEWTVNREIIDATDDTIYKTIGNIIMKTKLITGKLSL